MMTGWQRFGSIVNGCDFKAVHRSGSGSVRFCPVPVRFGSGWLGPVPVRFGYAVFCHRFGSGSVFVRFRFGSVRPRVKFGSGSVPVARSSRLRQTKGIEMPDFIYIYIYIYLFFYMFIQ